MGIDIFTLSYIIEVKEAILNTQRKRENVVSSNAYVGILLHCKIGEFS
jgi:hypothetical protein